jgi:predicted pyridoxine 5'-phosphate oxidase superfamily flavin-nucleotide-binding protein
MASRFEVFHDGERTVQARLGVRAEAEHVGRGILPRLPPGAASFLARQTTAAAATVDRDGRVWASLLAGSPGLIQAVDDELVLVDGGVTAGDPLLANLAARPEVGLLVIDLPARRRLRINGRALVDGRRVFVDVERAYGNCPRYIRPRDTRRPSGPPSLAWSATLNPVQAEAVTRADTFFVATTHPGGGPDASHRGGLPGFLRVLAPGRLAFADAPGNNMFNTLGNLVADPRLGLLVLDFETGTSLQLTGRARIDWDARAVEIDVHAVLESRGGGLLGQAHDEL